LQELFCADDPALYAKCMIQPVGQIDRQLIISEKPNIDQIVATDGFQRVAVRPAIHRGEHVADDAGFIVLLLV
jgi:hypothetical protein